MSSDTRTSKEARLRFLVERLPGAVWTAGPDLVVDWCAGACAERLELQGALGRCVVDHPVTDGVGRAALQGVLDGQGPLSYELRQAHESYDVRIERLDEEGEPSLIGIALDVTERRRLEVQRLRARLQRSQKLESLGLLAGGIAHDFNNLLAIVMSNASLAMMRLDPDDLVARPLLERVTVAAERAADLTRQLLAYSGQGRFVVEPVHLSELVGDMASLLAVSVGKGVVLQLDLASDVPLLEADAAQLRQVSMNLITNASEALGEGQGTIRVSTGVMQASRDDLAMCWVDENLPQGTYVWLEVGDDGCGMAATTQARMFDPFYTTKEAGHGLGLAAVLGIVRAHRGAVRVESYAGVGTVIRVLLPAGEGLQPARDRHTPPPVRSVQAIVLVVDDEPEVRSAASAALRVGGFQVLEAGHGEEAFRVLEARPDVAAVLLDLTMPGIGGDATFRKMRALRPELRVVLTSGYDGGETIRDLAHEGLASFLQKPYRASELIDRMRRVLVQG